MFWVKKLAVLGACACTRSAMQEHHRRARRVSGFFPIEAVQIIHLQKARDVRLDRRVEGVGFHGDSVISSWEGKDIFIMGPFQLSTCPRTRTRFPASASKSVFCRLNFPATARGIMMVKSVL